MNKIIVATHNQGKLREIRKIAGENVEVLSSREVGAPEEVDETGKTFTENALLKCRTVWSSLTVPSLVIADDSGLAIDIFGGAPGIFSSRWLGEDTDYTVKCEELMHQMAHVPDTERGAHYVCAMAAKAPDGREFTVECTFDGIIGHSLSGSGGFGYDPLFYLPDLKCTAADLSSDAKNAISHRGKALRALFSLLKAENI